MGMILAIAGLWGLAEATVFLIVPDVILTWIAVKYGWMKAFWASLAVCAGAIIGGAIMYAWGSLEPDGARDFLDYLPAISAGMISEAGVDIQDGRLIALIEGIFSGTPYKVYAVEAGNLGSGSLPFLAMSIPARLLRFWAAIAIAVAVSSVLRRRFFELTIMTILVAFWFLFYVAYFSIMPS